MFFALFYFQLSLKEEDQENIYHGRQDDDHSDKYFSVLVSRGKTWDGRDVARLLTDKLGFWVQPDLFYSMYLGPTNIIFPDLK